MKTAISAPAAAVAPGAAAPAKPDPTEFNLRADHDLNLPAWGPYTKKYFGISHIPVPAAGFRFDLGFFPGFFRRTGLVPNVEWESGYHPWEAAPDLSYYSTRYEVEWKDRVYVDLSFTALDPEARLIACDVVNQTAKTQSLALHFMASMQFPAGRHSVALPPGALWVDALAYDTLTFAAPRPSDILPPDGRMRAEVRDPQFVGGGGIGQNFGATAGDKVAFAVPVKQAISEAVLVFRYRNRGTASCRFELRGLTSAALDLPPAPAFATAAVSVGGLQAGSNRLELTALGGAGVDLDGFAIVESGSAAQVAFHPVAYSAQPEIAAGPNPASLLLKYKDVDCWYGLAWDLPQFQIREVLTDELDDLWRHRTHDHFSRVIKGSGDGHYTDAFLRPVTVAGRSSRTVWGLVCTGTRERVLERLSEFPRHAGFAEARAAARQKRANPAVAGAGAPYAFSQERMAATTLSNVIYPLHLRGVHIRHNTPGRWWDSFYTWDSGFTGLGLLEHDASRAVDCLNTYTTAPGDPHAAYLHHGTPVPVQIFLFLELWNRTQSRQLLEYFYPRLRQMHMFLVGRTGGSTARRLPSHLLTTWDYFYNTGWDDYPPQVYMHAAKLTRTVAPVANTAYAIRTARILRMAATALGLADDAAIYDADIKTWTDALQRFSWDEKSGYFGYVTHDASGKPEGILRYSDGSNFNMGLDGVLPLISGICSGAQVAAICRNLMSERRLWTAVGLSVVDQSAAYYRNDGYWNGSVWMPHQWFLWKTMLDLGKTQEAARIAHTGLDVWKNEVEDSYNCFEHFLVQSGRGAGWHQFTSLSSPVMCWYGAYYRPGRLTAGFDVWVHAKEFSRDCRSLDARLEVHAQDGMDPAVIATMDPARSYRVTLNGAPAEFSEIHPGTLQVRLGLSARGLQRLKIEAK